jgi:hypothetical protein
MTYRRMTASPFHPRRSGESQPLVVHFVDSRIEQRNPWDGGGDQHLDLIGDRFAVRIRLARQQLVRKLVKGPVRIPAGVPSALDRFFAVPEIPQVGGEEPRLVAEDEHVEILFLDCARDQGVETELPHADGNPDFVQPLRGPDGKGGAQRIVAVRE